MSTSIILLVSFSSSLVLLADSAPRPQFNSPQPSTQQNLWWGQPSWPQNVNVQPLQTSFIPEPPVSEIPAAVPVSMYNNNFQPPQTSFNPELPDVPVPSVENVNIQPPQTLSTLESPVAPISTFETVNFQSPQTLFRPESHVAPISQFENVNFQPPQTPFRPELPVTLGSSPENGNFQPAETRFSPELPIPSTGANYPYLSPQNQFVPSDQVAFKPVSDPSLTESVQVYTESDQFTSTISEDLINLIQSQSSWQQGSWSGQPSWQIQDPVWPSAQQFQYPNQQYQYPNQQFQDPQNQFIPLFPADPPVAAPGWTESLPVNSSDTEPSNSTSSIVETLINFVVAMNNKELGSTASSFDGELVDLVFPNEDSTLNARQPSPIPGLPFTPTGYKEECIAADGEMGVCMSASQCTMTNGAASGLCHQGLDNSGRVCCTYPASCGWRSNQDVTYFKNPEYPNITSHQEGCLLEIDLLPGVCQVRLDFLDFELPDMVDGVCSPTNKLTVSSNVPNSFIPVKTMCGSLTRTKVDFTRSDLPHVYLHLDRDVKTHLNHNYQRHSVNLNVDVTDRPGKWNVRVSQIRCDGAPLQAPPGCGQYQVEGEGRLTSLNFNDGSYTRDLSLTTCLKLDHKACAISYFMDYLGVGRLRGNKLGYGLSCGDYVTFAGQRTGLCGNVQGREVILPVSGPQGLTLNSDSVYKGKEEAGFDLTYRYIYDCEGVGYFQWPSPQDKKGP